jgi:PAS domain S-box-containing protein
VRWLSINTRAMPDSAADEPPFPVVATFADISARKRAEHEAGARAAELERLGSHDLAGLEALFSQSRLGMALLDRELRFVRINDALARINRLPVEAHIGHTLSELFPADASGVEALLRQVLEQDRALVDIEVLVPDPDLPGVERHFVVTYTPMHDNAGRVIGISTLVADATERRRAELERERLAASERHAAARTARLHALTVGLAGALTAREVAAVLAREAAAAVHAPRGWVSLLSADGRTFELAASVGYPDGSGEDFERIPAEAPVPGPDAARDRRPRYFASAADFAAAYPALGDVYRASGNEAGAVIPLAGPRGPLGFLALADPTPHDFGPDDRALLATIALQSGQALDRAAIYEREHSTAQILSQSLLPRQLPSVPGVELAARYEPAAASGAGIGGDFYDAFHIGAGRWMLVIGDVCGKGPEAAAVTALVRYTLRAEALHTSRPRHLLRVLNDAILAQRADFRFCTLACVQLDLERHAQPTLQLSVGGHPAPLLVRADGAARPLDISGTLLGVVPDPVLDELQVALQPGDRIVLYTDGLLEAHAPQRILAPEDLAARLTAQRELGLDAALEDLRRHSTAPWLGPIRDDVALLAAQLRPDLS